METSKFKTLVLIVALALLTQVRTSSCASFQDCYTKCFIFCMIEPSKTVCSCTTRCLKDCIFKAVRNEFDDNHLHQDSDQSLKYCKLGCAFSMCSGLSTKRSPNGDKVDSCVGSCSDTCTKSHSLP